MMRVHTVQVGGERMYSMSGKVQLRIQSHAGVYRLGMGHTMKLDHTN